MVKKILKIFTVVVVLYLLFEGLPYFFATYKYNQLIIVPQLTKKKVEKILFLSSHKKISIKKSLWGKNTKLAKNESCWQYMVLWKEPIDIIYDEDNKVIHIFESFE